MTKRCKPQLVECISSYSLHTSYCWGPMSIITNLFFSLCIYSSIVPPLDGMHEWKSAKSRNQPLFRSIMKLGTYNKPANQQSNWPILNYSTLLDSTQNHLTSHSDTRAPVIDASTNERD